MPRIAGAHAPCQKTGKAISTIQPNQNLL